MQFYIKIIIASLMLITLGHAQAGGDFVITQSVIAGGGGTSTAAGNAFTVTGTIGQPKAGDNSSGTTFNVKTGFWVPEFAPTAAHVSISGRVTRLDGTGLNNAVLTLSDGTLTSPKIAISSSFGYFKFEGVEIGQVYVLTVTHRRFTFNEPVRFLNVVDELSGIDFQSSS
jgi:hypothetical protein